MHLTLGWGIVVHEQVRYFWDRLDKPRPHMHNERRFYEERAMMHALEEFVGRDLSGLQFMARNNSRKVEQYWALMVKESCESLTLAKPAHVLPKHPYGGVATGQLMIALHVLGLSEEYPMEWQLIVQA